jgi:leader peptidase (prepilin peptidase)/N-methyltransferase
MNALGLAAAATLSGLSLALAWSDLRSFRLPHALTFALAASGLLFITALDPGRLTDHVLGLVLGFVSFELIAWGYRRVRGREGLGGGDARLMAGAGAWVGWQGLPSTVLVGALAALTVTLVVAALRGNGLSAAAPVPLGAYLALGLWVTWLFGPLTI